MRLILMGGWRDSFAARCEEPGAVVGCIGIVELEFGGWRRRETLRSLDNRPANGWPLIPLAAGCLNIEPGPLLTLTFSPSPRATNG